MTARREDIDKSTLKQLILIEGKSQREAAKQLNCTEALVSKRLKEYGLSRKVQDKYIGKRFGLLTPLEVSGYDKHSHIKFQCFCECGNEIEVLGNSLITGNTTTCGCEARKRGKDHANFIRVVHCKKEKYDVYIGRPSKFGNPFVIGKDGDRPEVIAKYKAWLLSQTMLVKEAVDELSNKVLACWCAPQSCHGDVLVELVDLFPTALKASYSVIGVKDQRFMNHAVALGLLCKKDLYEEQRLRISKDLTAEELRKFDLFHSVVTDPYLQTR